MPAISLHVHVEKLAATGLLLTREQTGAKDRRHITLLADNLSCYFFGTAAGLLAINYDIT